MDAAGRSFFMRWPPLKSERQAANLESKIQGTRIRKTESKKCKTRGHFLGRFRFLFVLVNRTALNVLILAVRMVFRQGRKPNKKSPAEF